MPAYLKILIGGVPVLVVIVWFVNMQISGTKHNKRFFGEGFSSFVIKSDSYYGRSVEYHLDNGLTVYFLPPVGDKIMIGDSVTKERNTYNYSVYRKDDKGEYVFFATYDMTGYGRPPYETGY